MAAAVTSTLSTVDGEKIGLLEIESSGEALADIEDERRSTKESMSLIDAFYVMFGFSMGTGVLIISYIILELGLVGWVISLACVACLQCLCTFLLSLCTQKLIENNTNVGVQCRDPFQAIAEMAGGRGLRKFSIFIMYAACVGCCVSVVLLASSMFATFIPIGTYSHVNVTRVWASIIITAVTPIMFSGTYSELKIPALVAVVTSLVSAVGIAVNSILKSYIYTDNEKSVTTQHTTPMQSIFVSIGSIIFMTCGASLTVSNLTVLAHVPRKLVRSITGCYVSIIIVYLLSGLLPYIAFNGRVSSSIMITLRDVIRVHPGLTVFKVVTMTIQTLMLIHLIMAAILAMNPVFLHMEEILSVPRELNWKRLLLRSVIMLFILGVCLCIPQFEFAIGLAGGVPLSIMGIFLPLFMYSRMFELNIYSKVGIYLLMVVVAVFICGNLVESIRNLTLR